MRVKHILSVRATCPVDKLPDIYRCIVETEAVIPVEDILAAAKSCLAEELFQEDICQRLHRRLNAKVTLIGHHSGVETIVECGGP